MASEHCIQSNKPSAPHTWNDNFLCVYDAQDRLTAGGGYTYGYAHNGELSLRTGAGTASFNYDAFGNLRSVGVSGLDVTYVIDGLGRRIGKRVGGSLVQGFLYAGSRIVAQLDSGGQVVSRFVYATGSQSPDLMLRGSNTYRIVKDHLGSPRLVV